MKASDRAMMADALWRAMTYVSVAQVHLIDNLCLRQALRPEHVKARPSGHWGTVPGIAWVLSHLTLAAASSILTDEGIDEVVPVIGAGHAGSAQLALAWLTGDLVKTRSRFTCDETGLRELARAFPGMDGLGHEVNPALPGGVFVGGQLGPALPFAQGYALDAPGRLVVPVVGDGECETPVTAASWLPGGASSQSGLLLPVVHLNGHRMGSPSFLARLSEQELIQYFSGLGWTPFMAEVHAGTLADHGAFIEALDKCVQLAADGVSAVIVMRCIKGWGGPAQVDGRTLLGTSGLHKTPLRNPRQDPAQLALLGRWLTSYRPGELFAEDGTPAGELARALSVCRDAHEPNELDHPTRSLRGRLPRSEWPSGTFAEAVSEVVRRHAKPRSTG